MGHLNRTVLEMEKNNKSETSNTQSNACSDNVSSNSDQSTKADLLNSPKTPTNEIITTNETPSPGSGFINSPYEELINNPNPVEGLLNCIWVLHFIIIVFLVILLITIISKLIFSLDYQFNWLNQIFSKETSIKIRFILSKILNIINKIRDYNILMFVIFLIIISMFHLYLYSEFMFNLESMCKLYLKILSDKRS